MADAAQKAPDGTRREFRNLHVTQIVGYRLPLAGIVSILHRISGALMFVVGIPLVLYLFQQSLTSEISFEGYRAIVSHWFVKLVLLGLAWAYLHHLFAGIRYLLLDLHIGVEKAPSRKTALATLVISLTLTLVVALKIFGAF